VLNNITNSEQSLQYLVPLLQEFELSQNDFKELVNHCEKEGILFLCTAFDEESASFIETFNVPLYKTASCDLTNMPLIEYLSNLGKPLLISTGMSTLSEIEKTVIFLKNKNIEFVLLHCNSSYPAAFKDLNLKFMNTLREKFDVNVGYSGHERGISIAVSAVAMGACVIEKHFTLDRTMKGPDHAASLEPPGLEKMIRDIRNFEEAKGTGTRWLTRGEILNREVLAKSLISRIPIPKGTVITQEMIISRSPGKGLSPQKINELIGKKAKRDIPPDSEFYEQDIGEDFRQHPRINIPQKWGVICRFADINDIIDESEKCVEFHLSNIDMNAEWKPIKIYLQELVLHGPEYWNDRLLDMASDDKSERAVAISIFQKTIDIAKRLTPFFTGTPPEGPVVVIHPGGMTCDEEITFREHKYTLLADSLKQINADGVRLLLENMPPLPWYFGGQWYSNIFIDPNEIRKFCTDNGFYITFDTSHAMLACNYKKYDFFDYTNKLIPLTKHLHVADAAGLCGEGLQIGEGEIDFKRLIPLISLKTLTMVPEIWMGHKYGGEGFWSALQRLEKYY
jgi:N-acetylneuraminate synthase